MAEENINPFPEIPEEQRLTSVEDAYVDAYESFKPYQLTEEDVFEQVRSSDSPEEATSNIAETIVDAMVEGYNLPEVTLESLKDGTSPFYKYLREKTAERDGEGNIIEDKSLDAKGFGADRNILNFFSNLSLKDNPRLEGLLNQIGPSVAFSTAFIKSAQSIYKAAPGGRFAKMAYAALGSIPIGFLASNAVDYVQENIFNTIEFNLLNYKVRLFGEELPVQPEQRAQYLSGKAFADFISFMPMPYMIKSGTKMGAAKVMEHLKKRAEMIESSKLTYVPPTKKGFFGTAKPTPLGKDFQTYLQQGKFPLTRRFATTLDSLLREGIGFAKNRPLPFLITESGFAVGGSLGTEIAETQFPGDFLPRFGAETSLGFGGAASAGFVAYPATRIFFGGIKAIYNTLTKGSPTGKPLIESFRGFQDKIEKLRQRAGVKGFLNFLEKYGVDSEKFVKKLDNAYMGLDKKFLEEFNLDVSALEKLSQQSVGFKSGEPIAILYESSLMSNLDHLPTKRAEMFEAAEKATLNLIKILKGSGNDEAIKVAGQIEYEMLKNAIATNIDNAVAKSLAAFNQLKGSGASNQELSDTLFNTLKTQLKLARKMERDLYDKVDNFEITGSFDGLSPETTPSFLSAFVDKNVMSQDKDIKSKLTVLPGFRDALVLYNRLRAQLGIKDPVDTSKFDTNINTLFSIGEPKGQLDVKTNKIILQFKDALRSIDLDADNINTVDDFLNLDLSSEQLLGLQNYFRLDTNKPKANIYKGMGRDAQRDEQRRNKERLTYFNNAKDIVGQLLKRRDVVDAEDTTPDFEPVTYETLRDFRTEILDEATKFASQGNTRKARSLSLLAESIRQDIIKLGDDANAGDPLKKANEYSFALNEVFTRTAMGKSIVATEKSGALVTPPELLFEKLQGLNDATAFRYKELENIHNFLRDNEIIEDVSFKDAPTYNNILYHLVRNNRLLQGLISKKKVKTSDGEKKEIEVLASKSASNLLKNPQLKELLEFFPDLKLDLEDALKKQSLLEAALDGDGAFLKSLNEQGSLAKIIQYDDPSAYMAEILRGKKPITELTALLKNVRDFVKKNPNADALKFTKEVATIDGKTQKQILSLDRQNLDNGFKEALLNHILTKSGMNQGGKFSPQKAYSMLFDLIPGAGGRRKSSLAGWMKNSGLITDRQLNLYKEVLQSMAKIDVQMRGGNLSLEDFNAFQTFAVSTLGSLIGTTSQRTMGKVVPGLSDNAGPGSLIAAQQGADFARKIFMAIPESLRQSAMIKVMNDPSLFVQLTRELKEGQPINYYGAILGALKKAGLIASSITLKQLIPVIKQDEDEGEPGFSDFIKQKLKIEKNIIPPDIASVDLPQAGSPTTQVASRLNRGMKTPIAANVGTPPPAASIDRNRFASLFPNDPISGLINAQQQGTTQFMEYGGMAGNPSLDMGLETDVEAQKDIQSALENTTTRDDDQDVQTLPSTLTLNQDRRPTGITAINLPGYAGRIANELKDFVTGKKSFQPFLEQLPGGGFNFGAKIPMNFFANGGFVDDSEIGMEDDSQITQSDFDYLSSLNEVDFDAYASAPDTATGIASVIAQPQVGGGRSNIRGSKNYDPIYAQALNITRGLLPGNKVAGNYLGAEKFQGFKDLTRPPSLTPQVPGALDMRAGYGYERPMFFSGLEKFAIQDAPDLVRQAMDMGIMGLARKAGDYFSSNFSKLFGGDEEVTPQKVKAQDKDITANDIIGNPNYSINIRRLAGEPLSDILKSRSR